MPERREELRCVSVVCGSQYVETSGVKETLLSFADNSDSLPLVCILYTVSSVYCVGVHVVCLQVCVWVIYGCTYIYRSFVGKV